MTFRGNHVDELISASLTGDLTDAERLELNAHLVRCETCRATLAAFTAGTIADAIATHAANANTVYVCGGGARNGHLLRQLAAALATHGHAAVVRTTDALGIAPDQVEALAFAWLAYRFDCRQPGNLPAVTGARGLRILGALYPAH